MNETQNDWNKFEDTDQELKKGCVAFIIMVLLALLIGTIIY